MSELVRDGLLDPECERIFRDRTKRLILETYDRMAEAIASGTAYSSPFDEG